MGPAQGRETSKAKRRRLSLAAVSRSTTGTEGSVRHAYTGGVHDSVVVDGAAAVRTYFRMPGMGKAKNVLLARFTGATEDTRRLFVATALLGSGPFKMRRRLETSTLPPRNETRHS